MLKRLMTTGVQPCLWYEEKLVLQRPCSGLREGLQHGTEIAWSLMMEGSNITNINVKKVVYLPGMLHLIQEIHATKINVSLKLIQGHIRL